jgi:hypothetical protein
VESYSRQASTQVAVAGVLNPIINNPKVNTKAIMYLIILVPPEII